MDETREEVAASLAAFGICVRDFYNRPPVAGGGIRRSRDRSWGSRQLVPATMASS